MKKIVLLIFTMLALIGQPAVSARANQGAVRLLNSPAPLYPPLAQERNQNGFIRVAMHFDHSGKVVDIDILEADNRRVFEQAVLMAASSWKLAPSGEQNVRIERTFVFVIDRYNKVSQLQLQSADAIRAEVPTFKQWIKHEREGKRAYRDYLKRKHQSQGK